MPQINTLDRYLYKDGEWVAPDADEMIFFKPPGALDKGIFTSVGAREGRLQNVDEHQERFNADYFWCFDQSANFSLKDLTPPDADSFWRIRIMAIGGKDAPELWIAAVKVNWNDVLQMKSHGVAITYHNHIRHHGDTGYNHKRLGLPEEFKIEPNTDSIILNNRGQICEASYANVFIKSNGEWLTPPLDSPCLPGVQRRNILAAGEINGIAAKEAVIVAADLVPEQAFMTSSGRGFIPISNWNGTTLSISGLDL